MIKAAGGKIWSPSFSEVTDAYLKEAHNLGIKVIVWTVNDPVQIKRMLDHRDFSRHDLANQMLVGTI